MRESHQPLDNWGVSSWAGGALAHVRAQLGEGGWGRGAGGGGGGGGLKKHPPPPPPK